MKTPALGFIGFGEVAYHLSLGFTSAGINNISAYDSAIVSNKNLTAVKQRVKDSNVNLVGKLKEVITGSDIIFSTVHGNVALSVAMQASEFLGIRHLYVDINNTSPATKLKTSEIIIGSGTKFVDLELFEPPARAKQKSFFIASGDGAKEFIGIMNNYGMVPLVVEGAANKASEIKALANIYFKGIQALSLELAISAIKAGIDLSIIAPLVVKPVKNIPDEKELAFWILRGILHAGRKTAELQDINQAMRDWGVDPLMMDAAVKRLNLFAGLDLKDALISEPSLDDCSKIMAQVEQISKDKGIEFK